MGPFRISHTALWNRASRSDADAMPAAPAAPHACLRPGGGVRRPHGSQGPGSCRSVAFAAFPHLRAPAWRSPPSFFLFSFSSPSLLLLFSFSSLSLLLLVLVAPLSPPTCDGDAHPKSAASRWVKLLILLLLLLLATEYGSSTLGMNYRQEYCSGSTSSACSSFFFICYHSRRFSEVEQCSQRVGRTCQAF